MLGRRTCASASAASVCNSKEHGSKSTRIHAVGWSSAASLTIAALAILRQDSAREASSARGASSIATREPKWSAKEDETWPRRRSAYSSAHCSELTATRKASFSGSAAPASRSLRDSNGMHSSLRQSIIWWSSGMTAKAAWPVVTPREKALRRIRTNPLRKR